MVTQLLTPYEKRQVERIAAWKGRRPGVVKRTVELAKLPLDLVLEKVLPAHRAERMLLKLNQAVDWEAGHALIRREAGVDDLVQLRTGTLERCDRLEKEVERAGAAEITAESLLGGVGGLATELAALPTEVMLALHSVHRIAGCYGYVLHRENDKSVVLAIIALSMVEEPEDRVRWCAKIWSSEHGQTASVETEPLETALEEDIRGEVGDDAVEEVCTSLLEQKLGESIPFLGEGIGIVLDNAFLHEVEDAARCIFQERWLRENGKIDAIAPAESSSRAEALQRNFHWAAYLSGYGLGFALAFPAVLIGRAASAVLPKQLVSG